MSFINGLLMLRTKGEVHKRFFKIKVSGVLAEAILMVPRVVLVLSTMSIDIILRSPSFVGKNLVSFADFNEPVFCLRMFVFVRMPFPDELLISLFNISLTGSSGDP